MKPSGVAKYLRRVAQKIDNSKAPERRQVILALHNLQAILMGGHKPSGLLPDDEAWDKAWDWYVKNVYGDQNLEEDWESQISGPSGIFALAFPENWRKIGDDPQPAYDRIKRFCRKHGIPIDLENAAIDHAKKNWSDFVKYYRDNKDDPGAGSILDTNSGP